MIETEGGRTDVERWWFDGGKNGWEMPSAPRWKRLPIIRHVRAIFGAIMVERWYHSGPGLIGIRTGYDEWVLFGIWHGLEGAQS